MQQPAILFVCLGNICRSPLAEAAFRHHAAEAGLAAHADSAGTSREHAGEPPDRRALAEARRHGIDITAYRARQVTAEDFTRFTHIFAADRQNLAGLTRLAPPGVPVRPTLLLDLLEGPTGRSVADPWYGGPEDFARTWTEVDAAARALVAILKG